MKSRGTMDDNRLTAWIPVNVVDFVWLIKNRKMFRIMKIFRFFYWQIKESKRTVNFVNCALGIPAVHSAVCAPVEVCTGIHLCQRMEVKINFQSTHRPLFIYFFSTFGWDVRVKKCQTRPNNMTLSFFLSFFLSPHFTHITINKQWNCFYWKPIPP